MRVQHFVHMGLPLSRQLTLEIGAATREEFLDFEKPKKCEWNEKENGAVFISLLASWRL